VRKSQAIKLALLGTGAFAVSCCVCGGCGGGDDQYDPGPSQVAEYTDNEPEWYDAQGNRIEEEYTLDEDGKLIPVGEPHDRFHRPLRFDENGNRLPLGPMMVAAAAGAAAGSAYHRHSTGFWPFWSSRSSSYGRSYSPSRPSGTASGGSSYFGGSRPGTSSAPKSSGSVSRGGFGSGGASAAS
jgi:hypothetical protein